MNTYVLILLPSVLAAISNGVPQDSTSAQLYDTAPLTLQKIEEDDLKAFRGHPDFDYEIVQRQPNWWIDFKTWSSNLLLQFFEWIFGVEEAAGFLAVFFRIIPYLLLALLIFILIKFFLKVNANALSRPKKNQGVVALSEEEHIIKHEDIGQLIQKALQAKDYRLAIRYYYLFILRLLSENEHIVWEPQKTNDDYLHEIKSPQLQGPFKKITRLYDYIWYGNFDIDETGYKKVETTFSSLRKILYHG